MALTRETATEYCDTALRHFLDSLSEWEETRIREWQAHLAAGGLLTERQGAVLDSILERCARTYGRERREC